MAAFSSDAARAVVERLARTNGVHVVIVSGRALATLLQPRFVGVPLHHVHGREAGWCEGLT